MAKENLFIETLKDILKNETSFGKDADDILIKNFYLKSIKGYDKIENPFYEWDSEEWMGKNIIPGYIYSFKYNAKTPTTYYINQHTKFQFTDTLPIVFITSENGDSYSGINLNLCTKDLRIIILNLIQNIDPEYFESEAQALVSNGKAPISSKLESFCGNPEKAQQQFLQYLKLVANIDYSLIFRTYKKAYVKEIQFIEPWMWVQIPYLTYTNDIKANILNDIHKANGFDKIKLSI